MAKYTMEQIDYLREKASITYEEALEALERFDGDLALCLVDLERKGRIKPRRPPPHTGSHYRYEYRYDQNSRDGGGPYEQNGRRGFDPRRGFGGYDGYDGYDGHDGPGLGGRFDRQPRGRGFVMDHEAILQGLLSRVVVRKDERVVADLPIVFLIFAALMAPHLMFVSVLLIFLMGYRVKWERRLEKNRRANDLFAFVDKTAEQIRRTAGDFARAVKSEVRPSPAREEDAYAGERTNPSDEAGADRNDPDDLNQGDGGGGPDEITIE